MLLLVGCGSSLGTTDAVDGAGQGSGTVLTVNFEVTGDAAFSGSTTEGPLSAAGSLTPISCPEFAQGYLQQSDSADGTVTARIFSFPALLASDPIGGATVLVNVGVFRYPGPGTYTKRQLTGIPGEVALIVNGTVFSPNSDNPDSTLVIEADGSGSWTFPHLEALGSGENRGNSISGTMTWTCHD
ncbi:hypothetical protein ACFQE5_20670 [Pseudonocardia hispaniensis]|uniref:Lipoprotein n=1 Tax=Pseudonocardia hispaniensis TaxID=904933 RepID=A0ABW1J7Y9_9PSEU